MTRKHSIRLVSGAICIFLAVLISILDFTKDIHLARSIPEPVQMTQRSPDEVTDTEVCAIEGGPCEMDETLQILRGDTLSSVLARAEIDSAQATDVIEQLKKVFNPRELRPEHEIYIRYLMDKDARIKKDLKSLYIRPSIEIEINVQRDENGLFKATRVKKELKHQVKIAKGTIQNSLYIDAGKQNVPPKILHEMIQAFSYDVDFQRGFHAGDGYGVMYDTYSDPDSLREESGQLQFAILQLQDKTYRIYRFKGVNGVTGYYNAKGESIRKGLLRTPIDGARISSTFGSRRHPILGYTKMHKGVDFAAPIGTPIMAAGDGVVVKAEFWSTYGRYVEVRHNNEFSTAYAHLHRFARGIKAGSRVRQGQIIGYVGVSGRTSGPHLHYELIRYKKQINPNSIKMLPAGKLTGKDMNNFQVMVASLDKEYAVYQPIQESLSADAEENNNSNLQTEPPSKNAPVHNSEANT